MGIGGAAGRCGAAAGAFAQDNVFAGPNPDTDPGGIGAGCRLTACTLEQAFEVDGLAVPAPKTEDRVGLAQRKPDFDIVDGFALDVAGLDMTAIEFSCELAK